VPCWPDIWERFKHLLPLIGGVASLLAYIAIVVLLLWAPKLRRRWQRVTSRLLGVAALVPLAVVLPPVFLGLLLASGNPPTATRIVLSPSGQEARLSYNAGFLGRDYTEVALKRPGSCGHAPVFWHAGPSSLDDTKIEWLDDHHLSLTYHARSGDRQHCEQRSGEVTVICASLAEP
jgi:hypothetical protein